MKKTILSAIAITAVVLAFGLSGRTQARPPASGEKNGPYVVKIDNFSFGPAALTVPVGATVTWINQDDVPHTVVSSDGKGIKPSVLDTDEKFSHTFGQAGTYAYYCSIHPKMTGTLTVQ
jgi:plastocyanin